MAKIASMKSKVAINPMSEMKPAEEDMMDCEKHMGHKMHPKEALQKILDAEAIKSDKKMMAKMKEHVGHTHKVIKSIKELKAAAQAKFAESENKKEDKAEGGKEE